MIDSIVLNLFFPFPICAFFLTTATILFLVGRHRKLAAILTVVTSVIILGCGTSPLPTFLVNLLERQYPAAGEEVELGDGIRGVRYIAVLGGSVFPQTYLPLTSRLGHSPFARTVEAARIHRLVPESKIITSGRGAEDVTEAEVMFQLLVSIGVDAANLLIEDQSMNTEEQVIAIRRIVGDAQFVLVTSAIHMPRAMLLFQRHGMLPIPAATDHLLKQKLRWNLATVLPKVRYFQLFEYAWYEYLALAKAGYWW